MSMHFTEEQTKVIQLHNRNILVSAAAGSGKTAVLTERIVEMVSSGNLDIDRLLVVTFTSAAASEMKDRIRETILKRLEEQPENMHLQKQSILIHNAQITTISSFCLYLVKNHFQDIGLEPGFRVADEGELKLLKKDVLNDLLEECFQDSREEFLHCVETYGGKANEKSLEEYILRLHDFSISNPWPSEWLKNCVTDYQQNTWMEMLMEHIKKRIKNCAEQLEDAICICEQSDGPYMYIALLEKEKELLAKIGAAESYEEVEDKLKGISFDRLSVKKDDSVLTEKRDVVKNMRAWVKDCIKDLQKDYFFADFKKMQHDIEASLPAVEQLVSLTLEFSKRFEEKKREKNIIDFSDMEHMALEILLEDKEGEKRPSKTAQNYQEYFAEILIDEYQDSNLVQEIILRSISREGTANNRFMVGDVKQSIYKFRLARPELFLEKYETYETKDSDCQRIDLQKNFRSRKEVIEGVNAIFSGLMKKDMGGIAYDKKAALYLGAEYPSFSQNQNIEMFLIEKEKGDDAEELSVKETEAHVIAGKILEMVGHFQVVDKESRKPRAVRYGDIVVLLRTNAGWDEEFKKVFTEEGIPAHITSKTGYFSTWEVQIVLNILRIMDNPKQEIPLSSVLLSPLIGFKEEELAVIKAEINSKKKWYVKLKDYVDIGQDIGIREKCRRFLQELDAMREKIPYTPIHELLQEMIAEWGIYHFVKAMPAGGQRIANLDMLLEKAVSFENTSYHGLFHFIRYIEQMEKYDVDFGEANITDENADIVRIMSIHKSKGLEFPICFAAGLAKQFNKMDIRKTLVIDSDYGIGTDFMNPAMRTKTPTLRKNAIVRKMENDLIGEEIRILYVAMTRAKEKLILTACSSNIERKLENAALFGNKAVGNSYLELILAVLKENPCFEIKYMKEADLIANKVKEELSKGFRKENLANRVTVSKIDKELYRAIEERFAFVYPYQNLANLYTKTTVSELKKGQMEEAQEPFAQLYEEEETIPYHPKFIKEKETVSGTTRGSAYHRVLELLTLENLLHRESEEQKKCLREELNYFCECGKLSKEYKDAVKEEAICRFLQTSLANRMLSAKEEGKLFREQPFVLAISANRIKKEFPKEEWMLIQGIIDVYFEEHDELVVADYKTDRVASEQELIERYKVQLEYYSEALEQLTGKKVKEKIIYSFALQKEILL